MATRDRVQMDTFGGNVTPIRGGYRPDFDDTNPYTAAQRTAAATDVSLTAALNATAYPTVNKDQMSYNDKLFAYRIAQGLL